MDKLDPRSTALLLLDLQKGILGFAAGGPHSAAQVLSSAGALARRFRQLAATVVLARIGWSADGGRRGRQGRQERGDPSLRDREFLPAPGPRASNRRNTRRPRLADDRPIEAVASIPTSIGGGAPHLGRSARRRRIPPAGVVAARSWRQPGRRGVRAASRYRRR